MPAEYCPCRHPQCAHSKKGDLCMNKPNPHLVIAFLGAVCSSCYDKYPPNERGSGA